MSANIGFNVTANTSQAQASILGFSNTSTSAFERVTLSAFGLTGQMGSLALALGPVGVGFGVLVNLATLGVGALYSVAKGAADFAGEIHDLAIETGASVETLSAFTLTAKQAGLEINDVAVPLGKYNRLIGEAANGSEQARTKLTRLHVDWKQAVGNNEYALAALFKRVNELPPGIQRINAAQDAFGKSGAKMLDLIQSAGGDFHKFMEEARAAGRVLSEEDAAAADAFNDKLDEMSYKVQLAAYRFGKELLPEITHALDDISSALGANASSWETWGIATASAIARVRGGTEGIAKWMHGDSWSLRKLGQDIAAGRDDAQSQMMLDAFTRKYYEAFPDENPDKPKKKTGDDYYGGGGGKSKKDNTTQIAQGYIKLDEQEESANHSEVTARIKREYDRRIIDLAEYVKRSKEELELHFKYQSEDLDKEIALTNKSVKNRKEREEKVAEIEDKRTAAQREYEAEKTRIEDEEADKRKAAEVARAEKQKALDDATDDQRIKRTQALVDSQFLTEAQGAEKIGQLRLDIHDRAVKLLNDHLTKEEEGTAAYIALQKEIGVAEIERANIQEATKARIAAAYLRELEAATARYKAIKALQDQNKLDELEIARSEIEAAGSRDNHPTRKDRISIIRALTQQARDAEDERHRQQVDALKTQKEEMLAEATSFSERVRIRAQFNHAMENERRRHQQAIGTINANGKDDERKEDPFGETKDKWGKWKDDAKDAAGSVSESIGKVANTAFDSVSRMTDAFGSAIEANLLYGESIGKALKAALAQELAHVAAESAIESLKHAAWALGSLAFGDFSGAAKHTAASIAFAGVALATGVGASKLATSAGLKGATAGSSGSTAGGSAIANTAQPQDRQFNYGSQSPNFSSSQVAGEGSRGNLADALNRLATSQQMTANAVRENAVELSRLRIVSAGVIVRDGAMDARAALSAASIAHGHEDDADNATRYRQIVGNN